MNPPFFVEGRDDASPREARRAAMIADADGLSRWTACALKYVKPKGRLTAILPAARWPDLALALARGWGGLTLVPLWPRAGQPAKRILVAAIKGSRAAPRVMPGLALHGDGAAYTPEAEAILRVGAPLAI